MRTGLALFLCQALCLMALCATTACSREVNPPNRVLGPILAFGDSLTEGVEAADYPSLLEAMLEVTVINGGRSGEFAAEAETRLRELIDQHVPRTVILCHGANDLLMRQPHEVVGGSLERLIKIARGGNRTILLLGVPQLNHGTMCVPQFYSVLARRYGIAYDGALVPSVLVRPELLVDGLHPGAEGNRMIAGGIMRVLQGAGRSAGEAPPFPSCQ